MFWFIYLLVSTVLSLILARVSKKFFFEYFIFSLILFITPVKIEIHASDYAPALPTFIFNFLFEQNFSLRVLKPLLLSLPAVLFGIFFYRALKRKFF